MLIGDYGTSDFVLKRGGRLHEVTMAYECWGQLSVNNDNAILVFTGLSTGAHAASSEANPEPGWWEFMIGPGKAIDTDRFLMSKIIYYCKIFLSGSGTLVPP